MTGHNGSGQDTSAQVSTHQDMSGRVRISQNKVRTKDRSGQDRRGQDMQGLVEQEKTGQGKSR